MRLKDENPSDLPARVGTMIGNIIVVAVGAMLLWALLLKVLAVHG
jgi:hypothetical protein